MQKIRIVGLQADKQRVINALHKAGVIEVRKSALEMGDDKPGESLAAVSELLVRYHSAETILNKYIVKGKRVKVAGEAALPTQKLIQTAGDFKDIGEILSLDEKKTNYLENEIAKIDAATRVASLFAGSKMDFSILKSNVLGFSHRLCE